MKLLYTSGVWKAIWVKILGGTYYAHLEYGRPLGQDSWWRLLHTSVVWKTIVSKLLVKITIHSWSNAGYLDHDSW